MKIVVRKSSAEETAEFRRRLMAETPLQFVAWSALPRGIADPWLVLVDGEPAGYYTVWNRYYEGAVGECWIAPSFERARAQLLTETASLSGAREVRAQTNMPGMLALALDSCPSVEATNVLFGWSGGEGPPCPIPGLECVPVPNPEPNHPDSRDFAAVLGGAKIAQGGYLCHYNPPFADVHMEVGEAWRGRGVGAWFVAQASRAAAEAGKTPAARCNIDNFSSRRTLIKGGMEVIGHILQGRIAGAPAE